MMTPQRNPAGPTGAILTAPPVRPFVAGPVISSGAPPAAATAAGFKPYNGLYSGFLDAAYVSCRDGEVSVIGRLISGHRQRALRRSVLICAATSVASIGLLVAGAVRLDSATSGTSTTQGDDATGVVLLLLGMAVFVVGFAWLLVSAVRARRAAGPVEVRAPVQQVSRVRVGHNLHHLWWWLFIGPLALIPFFVGRSVLRMRVPSEGPTRPVVRLAMREIRHGDAELVAAELRRGGAN